MADGSRLLILMLFDVICVHLAYLLSLDLRFYGEEIPLLYLNAYILLAFPLTAVYFVFFHYFKLYRRIWMYAGPGDLIAVVLSVSAGALGVTAMAYFTRVSLPRGVIIMAWAFTVIFTGGLRFLLRLYAERKRVEGNGFNRRALIVGAGDAGVMVAREMKNSRYLQLQPVGFVDDDPSKLGKTITGLTVLGTRHEIPRLVEKMQADVIIIAMPSVGGKVIREIAGICKTTGADLKTLPGMYEIIDGKVSVSRLRAVQLQDLLRREPVRMDIDKISAYMTGKVVLVTGAGGSIGSELCRQAARLKPLRLVVLGHGENSTHKIWLELKDRFPDLTVDIEIADTRDGRKIEHVFQKHRPSVVFHAAAHKHVPLMELHPDEAVKTNLFGTLNVARAAGRNGAGVFVLISTDKAVNPSSVMGATKRLAEIAVQNLNGTYGTRFVSVRFGNVLGSNGSVVPLFEQQIKKGGPVTITHPEMERYFMTIPEAVNLVIQAGAMAGGGEIFVLDMGEPVKILDLAGDMIKLSGLEPGKDIEIVFTGIRQGEKLHENLFTDEENATATCHRQIFVARPHPVDAKVLNKELAFLEALGPGPKKEDIAACLRRIENIELPVRSH